MTIQNALTNFFGNKYKTYKGDIGLEIETETVEEYKVPKFSFWEAHPDNSLRGFGMEYTLKQPLEFETTFPLALEEFAEKTKDIPFVPDSITTSIHVHLNFLNDNFVTLGNFLTAYSMTENLLIRASGEDRLSNLYCLPICDAEETHYNMVRMFRGIREKKYGSLSFDAESTKYGALNLSALQQFGSLEMRSFRGTTDTKLIKDWVGILHSLQRYARTPDLVPPQIILNYNTKKAEYLTDIFGEYRKFVRHVDEEALIEKNFWYAAAFAYEIKDWSKLEQVVKPKKMKSKDLDKISQLMYGRPFDQLGDTTLQQSVIRQGQELQEVDTPPPPPERQERLNPLNGRYEMLTIEELRIFDREARRAGVGIYEGGGGTFAETDPRRTTTVATPREGTIRPDTWATYAPQARTATDVLNTFNRPVDPAPAMPPQAGPRAEIIAEIEEEDNIREWFERDETEDPTF
jgi:hypothetical protein